MHLCDRNLNDSGMCTPDDLLNLNFCSCHLLHAFKRVSVFAIRETLLLHLAEMPQSRSAHGQAEPMPSSSLHSLFSSSISLCSRKANVSATYLTRGGAAPMSIFTSGQGLPCCNQRRLQWLERQYAAGRGKSSDLPLAEGHLGVLPRAMRGYQIVNLYFIVRLGGADGLLCVLTIVKFILVLEISKLLKIDFLYFGLALCDTYHWGIRTYIAEHGPYPTKAFHELISFR